MLDDKLREILVVCHDSWNGRKGCQYCQESADEKILEIRQAFADNGWLKADQAAEYITHNKLMTGQEWYDRFEKELDKEDTFSPAHLPGTFIDLDNVMLIAKRASGLP